ncbi:MAG: type III secretion inner membrane ring lipoprotein SctJ [Puniceicoccales bacterium]|jgi:type III secretion protein J|nr:type III secretion inner membrane ring lipoprotein SctJ [Puniceicoccales bacterium]
MALLRKWSPFFIFFFAIFGSGCGRSPLYSNVSERQANEMIALLRGRNMTAEKIVGLEGTWTLQIPSNQFAAAVDILGNYGYPRDEFSTLGKVFQKGGLVSSPTEERARFMYALSENLAENISHIHGVVTARVNIVLPESNPYTETMTPSSAAVFISYRPGSGIEDAVRDIKFLVTNSIEGLSYDKVSVALFPTPAVGDVFLPENEMVSILSFIQITRSSLLAFCLFLGILVVGVAVVSFVGAKVIFDYMSVRHEEKQKEKKKKKKESGEGDEEEATEEGGGEAVEEEE